MTAIYRGTTKPLEQRFTEEFSPVNGVTRTLAWKSFDRAKVQAFADQYAKQGCSYHLDIEHGVAVLVATDTSGNYTIDVWEVGVSDILVSSLKNPRNTAVIGQDNLTVIARALRDGSTLSDAVDALVFDGLIAADDFADPFAFNGPADEKNAALRLYERMLAGSDSFFYSQYVVRHTTNVSNRYNINVSDVGVNRIYTQAQFLSEAQNATSWIFPLPDRLVYKLQAAFNADLLAATVPANYLLGWLKSASPESSAPYDRVNIVTEYKLFRWSTDEYAPF